MLVSMLWSMADEELLSLVDNSECSALVLELSKRLFERVVEDSETDCSEGGDSEVDDPKKRIEHLEARDRNLRAEVEKLEADVHELVNENDDLRDQIAGRRRESLVDAEPGDTPISHGTHRHLALQLLPDVGASMLSPALSRRLAEQANTTSNVAGNTIRKLIGDGVFRAEGRGARRTITRARRG